MAPKAASTHPFGSNIASIISAIAFAVPTLAAISAPAATFPVSNTNDSGAGSLRQAILDADAVSGSDVIVFDATVFNVPRTITLTSGGLAVNDSATITGPGAALLTVSGNNSSRIFAVDAGRTVAISGLTVTAGNSMTGIFPGNGGGILNRGTMMLTNVVVNANTATIRGGGIFNGATGALTLINSTVSNNTFGPPSTSIDGGGISNNGTALTLTNCVVSNNRGNGGGGINTANATPVISGSTISGNTAALGGGIYLPSGTLTLTDSTLSGNLATNGGAIRANAGAVLQATNVTISDNESIAGGGIYNEATLTLRSGTVVNNRMVNSVRTNGAGIRNFSGGTVNLGNTIVANNVVTATGQSSDYSGNLTSQGYNLIEDNSLAVITGDTTGNLTAVDPNLGPLQNNGGNTLTHALLTGSPALDKGASFGTTTDQRGLPRPFDDAAIPNAPGGDGADIGAFEKSNAVALQLNSAVSRKAHGAAGNFDVPLPLIDPPGVECRSSGGAHTLVFSFSNNVVSGSASVTTGIGSVSGNPVFSTNTMTVNLTGVADVQRIAVTLAGVTDSGGQVLPTTSVSMNMLIGDINASKTVNASDIGSVKSQSGIAVTSANFRADVVVSGGITASDIGLVKSRSGASVP